MFDTELIADMGKFNEEMMQAGVLLWVKRCPVPTGPGQEAEIEIRQVFEEADFPPQIFPPEDAAREREMREQLQKKAAKR